MTLREASAVVFGLARIGAGDAWIVPMEQEDDYGVQVVSHNGERVFWPDVEDAARFAELYIELVPSLHAEASA